jgi:hypothetical protein
MNVSPNALRKETVDTLKEVNEALDKAKFAAGNSQRVPPTLLAPLLLAKAQCLHTLTLLNEKR